MADPADLVRHALCPARDVDEPRLRCGHPLPCPRHPIDFGTAGFDTIAAETRREADPWPPRRVCTRCGLERPREDPPLATHVVQDAEGLGSYACDACVGHFPYRMALPAYFEKIDELVRAEDAAERLKAMGSPGEGDITVDWDGSANKIFKL